MHLILKQLSIFFDRYGKLLNQLNPAGPGWDGTFNNRHLQMIIGIPLN
jgi:gliding motility-associated-like protein